jgi:hypothetical protein
MTIRKSLAQVEAEGQVLADGTLVVYVSFIDKTLIGIITLI